MAYMFVALGFSLNQVTIPNVIIKKLPGFREFLAVIYYSIGIGWLT